MPYETIRSAVERSPSIFFFSDAENKIEYGSESMFLLRGLKFVGLLFQKKEVFQGASISLLDKEYKRGMVL